MKNNEYWEKRIAEKTWDTYNFAEEKNRKLIELYQDASRKIREELYELAEQLSKNGTLSRTEMYRQQHLQKLEKKYRKILSELTRKTEEFAKENMEQGIQEVYERISIALDVPEFSLPDKELMQKLIEEPWRNGNFSERLWKNQKKLLKALKNVLVVGMQQGKNITDMAVELNAAMGKGFYAAHRLVRTETMHCLNQSCLQRYKDAEIKKVSFWAAKDERTCEICGAMHGKEYNIEKAPVLPVHPNCRCTYLPVIEKDIAETLNSDIMNLSKTKEAMEVHLVGKINRDIYKCITEDIVTDDVIITDNQIQHIKDRHPNDYERFSSYFAEIVANPDYIIEANKPSTALVLKEIKMAQEVFKTVVRLATSQDNPKYKNSIITFMKIDEKEWRRLLRNKKILYKKE